MFYFKNWSKFCEAVSSTSIVPLKAQDVLSGKNSNTPFIVFKHDVETNPVSALKLAKIENKYNIRGTYYVQAYLLNNKKNVEILKSIQSLGHEVSYHYDVLDANDGDFDKANIEFKKNITVFESYGFEIKTVCQHGNPIKERINYNSNRDFLLKKEIADQYPYLADPVVNFKTKSKRKYIYISDFGYSWKIILNPESNDTSNILLSGFSAIIDIINKGNSVILSTHPHRWEKYETVITLKIIFFKVIRTCALVGYKIPLFKKILNKFYFLAKNI
jgi:hypothetical protein